MDMQKDKIIVQIDDTPQLAEFFSRKEAGDGGIRGRFTATLDESAEGVVRLSIDQITFDGMMAATPAEEEAPVTKMFKQKAKADKGMMAETETMSGDEMM